MRVSAYIPCFNSAGTIGAAIESIKGQTCPVDELFVVDDGSDDGSREAAEAAGARVVRHGRNRGRGATRATAMVAAAHDLVLCCDAAKVLEPEFLQKACSWLVEPRVAAVYGRISTPDPATVADRWQSRHLYLADVPMELSRRSDLITYGAVMRKSVCLSVGNYDVSLRFGEDFELGRRLTAAGYDVVFDPGMMVLNARTDGIAAALERYWRWNAAQQSGFSFRQYLRQIGYSVSAMASKDMRDGDPPAVMLSLLAPHYQAFKSLASGGKDAISSDDR